MSHFGITAIRWNADRTEVDQCMVHPVEQRGDEFVLGAGTPTDFSDVANLIVGGAKVWVMEADGTGRYDRKAAVQIRVGQVERLFTKDNSLFDLSEFQEG